MATIPAEAVRMTPLGPADIEALRTQYGPDTRGLVKALATRMLTTGERPTNARLRELAGRGSMTTIASALREWWSELKTDVQGTLEVPDVPDALIEPFQSAVGNLWRVAHEAAQADFDDQREAAEAEVKQADQSAKAAEALAEQARQDLAVAQERVNALTAEKTAAEERARQVEAAAGRAEQAAAERLQEAGERFKALAATAGQDRADAAARLAKLESERAHEREVLDGQLAFATKQIDDAREQAKAMAADLERERRWVKKTGEDAAAAAESAERAADEAKARQTALEHRCATLTNDGIEARAKIDALQDKLAMQAEAHAQALLQANDAAASRQAEAWTHVEAAQAKAAEQVAAAERVSRIYFEIAAEAIGEKAVREQFAAAMDAETTTRHPGGEGRGKA